MYFDSSLLFAILKGFIIGCVMAAIPGPIFFLIVQRTLNKGTLAGFMSGLGAVTADLVYALIAALGLTVIINFLLSYQHYITLIGGAFLIYLGIVTWSQKPRVHETTIQEKSLYQEWLSTFLLTLTNPVSVISFCAIFAGLGADIARNQSTAFALVFGLIIGAFSVMTTLVFICKYMRHKLSFENMALINKIASIVLIGFGIAALFKSRHCFFPFGH